MLFWPNGRSVYNKTIDIFNQNTINLNLSNNESLNLRYRFSGSNGIKNCLNIGKSAKNMIFDRDAKAKEMVKARCFKINAGSSLKLSYYVKELVQHIKSGAKSQYVNP